jgi:predicted MFS family arabinose efflux permease
VIRGRRRTLATLSLVSGTFTSVLATTILYVPIDAIARDLRVSVPAASLVITSASIAFATLLPIGGWLGNRFSRRDIFCLAVAAVGLGGLVAMTAHDLTTLVAMRVVQGAAAAAIVPVVMTLLKDVHEPQRHAFALGAWATANSLGQALGPPLGGVLASSWSWRAVFVPTAVLALLSCLAAWRYVPPDPRRVAPLEWRGALGLTLGALLLQVAFAAIPQLGPGSPLIAGLAVLGVLGLAAFARAIRTSEHPFVSPRAFAEPSYVTSCIAVFATTTAFGAALVAIPLYLIQVRHFTTEAAGFATFALPFAMAICAPLTSAVIDRYGSRSAVRTSLVMMFAGASAVGLVVLRADDLVALGASLLIVGAAVALSYTATAVGATETKAGSYGAGVGLYNLMRISGLGVGAAVVAIVLSREESAFAAIFATSSLVVLGALLVSVVYGRSGATARAG